MADEELNGELDPLQGVWMVSHTRRSLDLDAGTDSSNHMTVNKPSLSISDLYTMSVSPYPAARKFKPKVWATFESN